jgi:membrane fusion protein (multidrug efflux system)
VSPDLDPRTRTQTAKAEYPNEAGDVTPGSFADLEVVTEIRPDAPIIPEVALVTEGEQNFVYVIRDANAEKREVTLGERLDNRLEVTAGLEGGEVIVTEGHRELSDGAPVRFAERPAAPAGEVGPGRE